LKIFEPLYDAVSWIIVMLHRGLTAIGFDDDSGWAWGLSIVGLVVIIRIALIPLFVKQIKSMRNMQVLQPRIREIQQKHKNDRERQSQELMKLYKETGTNPLSSCLPIVAQAPFFFALFKVLDEISKGRVIGVLDEALVRSAGHAEIFGAPISARFTSAAGDLTVQIVTVVMILLMSASQFITQKQLMVKNLPQDAAANNPFLQQQKILLYVFPVLFAVFGINFPVGVLLYWLVSNLWSMGQQLFVIRRMPAPGSLAYEARQARLAKKGLQGDVAAAHGGNPGGVTSGPAGGGGVGSGPAGGGGPGGGGGPAGGGGAGSGPAPQSPQARRAQPQRQPRSKRTGAKKKR